MDKFNLFLKLKKHKLSNIKHERKGFKRLARQIEVKCKKIKKKFKIKPPLYYVLKGHNVSDKYLNCVNTKKSFKCKKFNFNRMIKNAKINPNFDGKILLPVHIKNIIFKKAHLNVLIINTKTKKITRLDPSNEKSSKILNKHVFKGLNKFFKKFGYKFTGYSRKSKTILHGGLCRYASPALYIYGKKLNHQILKKLVLNYLKNILNKCKIK